MKNFVTDNQFHKLAKENQNTEEVGVRKQYACEEVKAYDDEKRQIKFVISTESVDRYNDKVDTKGWQTDSYEKNPVVLFAHDNRQPPVAKAVSLTKRPKKKALESVAEFVPADISPFAESLYQLYKNGFMKASSVGFRPMDYVWAEYDEDDKDDDKDKRKGGINFKQQELLEWSLVPVPANPDALAQAKKDFNIELTPLKGWAEQVLDEWGEYRESGFHIPRRQVESFYKDVDDGTEVTIFLPKNYKISEVPSNGFEPEAVEDEEDEIKIFDHTVIEKDADTDPSISDVSDDDYGEDEDEDEEGVSNIELELSDEDVKRMIHEAIEKAMAEKTAETTNTEEAGSTDEGSDEASTEERSEDSENASVADAAGETESDAGEAEDVLETLVEAANKFLNVLDDALTERDIGQLQFNRKHTRTLKNVHETLNELFDVSHNKGSGSSEASSESEAENDDPLEKLVEALNQLEESLTDDDE